MPVDIIVPIHQTLAKKKSMSLAKSFQQELADGKICAIVTEVEFVNAVTASGSVKFLPTV